MLYVLPSPPVATMQLLGLTNPFTCRISIRLFFGGCKRVREGREAGGREGAYPPPPSGQADTQVTTHRAIAGPFKGHAISIGITYHVNF